MNSDGIKELGFDAAQMSYLCGMAQDVHPPTEFDEEVQRYLDGMEEENA
jgi:hypothetical protein